MMHNTDIISSAKQVFLDEINGITRVMHSLNSDFEKVINKLFCCKGKVITMGVGKSGHVATKIASTLASTGTPSFYIHPTEALHGDLGMIEKNDIIIGISFSGENDELIAIIPTIKHKNVDFILITGNKNSSLAKQASNILELNIEQEACPLNLAPTTSSTATLVLGDAISVTLLKMRNFQHSDFAISHPGGSLGRRLLTKVDDIMRIGKQIPVVLENTPFKDILIEISSKGLGFTIVTKNNNVVGIITDGDLRRIFDSSTDVMKLKASDIMNTNPKILTIGNLATMAINLMEDNKITSFIVVDNNKKLIGAFNLHDLFKAKIL